MYADVVIDIVNRQVDRPFSYRIPEKWKDAIRVGTPVRVPFGSGNALRKGYVISVKEDASLPGDKIKEIDSVIEKGLTVEEQLISLATAMRYRYGGTLYQCLSVVMPSKTDVQAKKPRYVSFTGDRFLLEEAIRTALRKKHYAKLRLLEAFRDRKEIPTSLAADRLRITSATLKALEREGLIRFFTKEEAPIRSEDSLSSASSARVRLNEAQLSAVESVLSGKTVGYLLHGVTGSGKTEVYIRLIEEVLRSGKEAIVLIPEIALTYQTVMRFYDRFKEAVSVVHSRLSKGEKSERFLRASKGEIKVMIGPRSALFTPFKHLGMVIVDEFHEPSYKSDQVPKYDAVEMALLRAELSGGKAVLGSATPLVEQYRRALNQELTLIRLNDRAIPESRLPEVRVVDMREELRSGNRSVFSGVLKEEIKDRLNKHEQIMLFLNRRGYSGAVSCRSCGQAVECPHCSVALNYHRDGRLKCHLCGFERPMIKSCPECGSKMIGAFGVGTEKVEELVQKEFPGIRTLRMDADTTGGKNGHQEILEKFFRHEADLLIGTQMVVKGHDFPLVTLVGILAADLSLFVPDFRSAERTFELLVQAEGRAGRREKEGLSVIQTYNPDHYAVLTAKNQDYEAFYQEEMRYRHQLSYPPEGAFLSVRLNGKRDEEVRGLTEELFHVAEEHFASGGIRFLGPGEEGIKKVKDSYRYCFYIKGKTLTKVLSVKEFIEEEFLKRSEGRKIYLTFES